MSYVCVAVSKVREAGPVAVREAGALPLRQEGPLQVRQTGAVQVRQADHGRRAAEVRFLTPGEYPYIHQCSQPKRLTSFFSQSFSRKKPLNFLTRGPKANSGPLSPYNEELFAVLSSRRMAMACLNSAQFQLICQKRYIFWKVRK